MNEKKFPLSTNEFAKAFDDSGVFVSARKSLDTFNSDTIFILEGHESCIFKALQAIVEECNEAQSSIDSAKDQEIAELKRQLAAAQNDVKQLRQSRNKRMGKSASIADLSVNVSVDSQKSSQMLGFLDEFAKCAKAMEQAAGEAAKALNRMAQDGSTGLIKADCQAPKTITHNGKTYPKGVWIDWHGGKTAPIPDGVWHKVKLQCGTVSDEGYMASTWNWAHEIEDAHIIAFMIL